MVKYHDNLFRAVALALLPVFFSSAFAADKALSESEEHWVRAYRFFEEEGNAEDLHKLRNLILEQKYSSPALIMLAVQSSIRKKDRPELLQTFTNLGIKNKCTTSLTKKESEICRYLGQIWTNNLDSALFFEDSAPKFEHARRLFVAKDCVAALAVLKEIESKESWTMPLVVQQIQVSECLGDMASKEKLLQKQRELRIF